MDSLPKSESSDHLPTVLLNAMPARAPKASPAASLTPALTFDSLCETPSPDKASIVIPGYEIRGVLGRGGMGIVYKARHLALNRIVALKVVLHGGHTSDADRQRFAQEAKAVARLNHPNVVQIFEVGEHDGHTYFAMEYVECGNLFSWQNHKPIAPRVVAEIVKTLAKAMQHAHEQGIVHRDLKPANILLRPSPPDSIVASPVGSLGQPAEPNPFPYVPKITDFGLAKLLDAPIDLTAPGITCGTPTYMSPEQIRNNKDAVGPQADLYSLGAMLYELLTGYPVYHGDGAQEIFELALNTQPTRLRALRSDIPTDLETICLKCLEKDRQNRYGTAAALAEDLSRFLSGRPILARRVGRIERTWRWCKRHPGPATALAVTSLALCLTTALSVMLWRAEGRAVAAKEAEELESDRLEIALGQLRKERDALALARDRETTEFHRAEENLRIARDATRATLIELTREPLLQEPKFLDVRKRLLDQAKPVFDQFVAQTTDNPVVLAEQAELCQMLGWLRLMAGDAKITNQRYVESLAFYSRLIQLRPTELAPILGKAESQLQYAHLLRSIGQSDVGNRQVDDCIAELIQHSARFTAHDELQTMLLQARLSYLHQFSSLERVRGAGENIRLATELQTQLTKRLGRTAHSQYLSAILHRQAALHTAQTGPAAKAEGYFTEALKVLEHLVATGTKDLNHRAALARVKLDYAKFLTANRRPADAREQLQQAIQQLDAILVESPRAIWYLMMWTHGTVALGAVEAANGNEKVALECYDRAAEQWFPVLDRYPEWVLGRQAARDLLSQRAALHEKQGKADLASADRARHDRICPP